MSKQTLPHAKVMQCFEQVAAAQAGTRRKQAQAAEHKARSNKQETVPLAQVKQWFEQLVALRSHWELCKDRTDRALATSGRRDDEQNKVRLCQHALQYGEVEATHIYSFVFTQHNGLSTPMLVRFLLGAQEALHEAVLEELDEEMSLHKENIWQLNDAIRKAIKDKPNQHHVVVPCFNP